MQSTEGRVPANTDPEVNRQIPRPTDNSIRYYSAHRDDIDERLDALDREWDIERTLEATLRRYR
jgi:hypothetical protein